MKFIAISDWHLGNLFHGNDRLPEHQHFFRWLLAQLHDHQPDALLVAGDVFDSGNPSAASQAAYYQFLTTRAAQAAALNAQKEGKTNADWTPKEEGEGNDEP